MKNGKVKASDVPYISHEQAFGGGTHDLPPSVKAEFDKQGWTPRWLSIRKMSEHQGVHAKGWEVYRNPAATGSAAWLNGTPPDGTIRRGDLVLGYKSREKIALHRAYLKQRKDAQEAAMKAFQKGIISEDDED